MEAHSPQATEGSLTPGKALLFVGLAAGLVRAMYFLENGATPTFAVPLLDQKYYFLFAESIVRGDDLTVYGGFRPVLYPLFVAAWLAVAGGAGGMVLAIAVQHLLGVATAVMTGAVGYLAAGRRPMAALAAGLLYAFAPPPVFFEGKLLIATMMTFLVAAMLLLGVVALSRPPATAWRWWVASGVVAALAAQARPNILLFFPLFGLVPLALLWRDRAPARLWMLLAVPALLAIQAGFGLVNQWQSGRYQFVTSAGGINFYVGNNAKADGMIPRAAHTTTYEGEYRDSIAVFAEVEYQLLAEQRGFTPSDDPDAVSDFWYAETWRQIGDAPQRWIGLMARKTLLAFGNYEIPNGESFHFTAREESLLLRLMPVRWAVLMLLLPAGAVFAWRGGSREVLLFLSIFTAIYAASFILFFVNSRFRIPLWPGMCALGGAGLVGLSEAWRAGRWRAIAPTAVTGAVLAALSVSSASLVTGELARDHDSRSFFFRSVAYYENREFQKAWDNMERAVAIKEPTGDMMLHWGNVEYGLGNYEAAIERYEESLRLEPGEPRTYNNIGAALEELGRPAEAHAAYLAALELSPRHRTALVNAALLELRAGRIDQAAERLEIALDVLSTGNDVALLVARGLLAAEHGDQPAMERFLGQANALSPAETERLAAQHRQKIDLPPAPDG